MTEVWLPVVGWFGQYEVSNLGGVRSVDKLVRTKGGGLVMRKGKQASRKIDTKGAGYLYTSLSSNGVAKKVNVHTLVLEAFIGPRPDGYQACHANGDRADARLSNLRWDSVKSNHRDKVLHGTNLAGANAPRAKLTEDQARLALQSSEPSRIVAERFGVASSTIRAIRLGQNWGGLHE